MPRPTFPAPHIRPRPLSPHPPDPRGSPRSPRAEGPPIRSPSLAHTREGGSVFPRPPILPPSTLTGLLDAPNMAATQGECGLQGGNLYHRADFGSDDSAVWKSRRAWPSSAALIATLAPPFTIRRKLAGNKAGNNNCRMRADSPDFALLHPPLTT